MMLVALGLTLTLPTYSADQTAKRRLAATRAIDAENSAVPGFDRFSGINTPRIPKITRLPPANFVPNF
jgi:hypothetical protein